MFVGMWSFSSVKTGKKQDVERVFNDCAMMTICEMWRNDETSTIKVR